MDDVKDLKWEKWLWIAEWLGLGMNTTEKDTCNIFEPQTRFRTAGPQ